MIWKQQLPIEELNAFGAGTALEHMGIEVTEIGPDYIVARMPVDRRTIQPMGLLHGGASVLLAESLGSLASILTLGDHSKHMAVGVEINANHLRSATQGYVYGRVNPIRLGRKIQVWNIEIKDDAGKPVCVSRLTIAIVDKHREAG
jgi:1,4-dihydroxy-2-naphthoyl-CoA hydrolase